MNKVLQQVKTHPYLIIGLVIIGIVIFFGPVGQIYIDPDSAKVGAAIPDLEPSNEYRLGTDTMGRDVLAVIIAGTPMTLRIGLIAGAIGLGVGTLLGFLAGYFGGIVDNIMCVESFVESFVESSINSSHLI